MIFIILEVYFEEIKKDTTSEHLDIKLQLSEFILPLRSLQHVQC
jgi:hypothetical protein